MPEQNEKKLPKAPAFNPKVKETIAAFKENNNPKNLNDILNELVRSPLLAPAVFDLQGQPAPKPEADGRVQLPKEIKISLVMVTSPEGKRYYPRLQRLGRCARVAEGTAQSRTADHPFAL